MALIRAISGSGGAGTPTLEYEGKITDISKAGSYTFTDDYDVVLVVTVISGSGSYYVTYDGVIYNYMSGYSNSKVALIPNVKANTAITFSTNIYCSIHGYNYA